MRVKLLVADESPTIHKIVAMAFESEGINVEGISRGEHALEYMVEFKPAVVLADIHLPGLDGYQLSREIKTSQKFAATRVILLTSDFEDIDEEQLKHSLADDTISKPFKSEEILNKVKSQLEISSKKKETPELETDFPSEPPQPEPEESDVIEKEFEDIVRKEFPPAPAETVPVKDPEAEQPETISEEPEPPAEDQEVPSAAQPETAEAPSEDTIADEPQKSERQPAFDEQAVETMAEVSEEAFRADHRPAQSHEDQLQAVFDSIQASPSIESLETEEDPAPREPGSRPNLIEETLSMMARHPIIEPEPAPEAEPKIEPVPQETVGAPDLELGRRVVKEHVDQIRDRLPKESVNGEASSSLEQTVREVLGEVGPKIIRKVIQEEIENIKKMEEA